MSLEDVRSEATLTEIHELIAHCGADPGTFDAELVTEIIQTSLKMLFDGSNTGQIKLMTRSLKELRYAYTVFNQYEGVPRISVFGSSRTPEEHPDYVQAKALSAALAAKGWMIITGAAQGIMKAGLEGASRAASFGLSIRLPNEPSANSVIHGDVKLMNFNYFFTRKVMFLGHSDAVAAFPGGVGTQDELFECLTLMQTGKTNLVPIVLMEGAGGHYWDHWEKYLHDNLLRSGWISPEDRFLYHRSATIDDAVEHILRFYFRFNSYRYVNDYLVIRLNSALTAAQVTRLNEEFAILVREGRIEQRGAFDEEDNLRDLPRLAFVHNRSHYGTLRRMIDQINSF